MVGKNGKYLNLTQEWLQDTTGNVLSQMTPETGATLIDNKGDQTLVETHYAADRRELFRVGYRVEIAPGGEKIKHITSLGFVKGFDEFNFQELNPF